MNHSLSVLVLVIAVALMVAGCTQPSAPRPETTPVPPVTVLTPEPVPSELPAAATGTPGQVVTIVHQVSLLKDVKDTDLLFALQVPVEWNPRTTLLNNGDNAEGLAYRTDLVSGDVFFIVTYAVSRSQDQAYRDQFRKWVPAPAETTVTSNGITWDRFESGSGGKTRVAYVARKGSANERGYASVLVFTADDADRFQKSDFEKVVTSFRYFSSHSAGNIQGGEIPRNG